MIVDTITPNPAPGSQEVVHRANRSTERTLTKSSASRSSAPTAERSLAKPEPAALMGDQQKIADGVEQAKGLLAEAAIIGRVEAGKAFLAIQQCTSWKSKKKSEAMGFEDYLSRRARSRTSTRDWRAPTPLNLDGSETGGCDQLPERRAGAKAAARAWAILSPWLASCRRWGCSPCKDAEGTESCRNGRRSAGLMQSR